MRRLLPCGTVAAERRHRRNNEPVCDPCRQAATKQRRKYFPEPTTTHRNHLTTPEFIEEVRFLINCGEGEHAILSALGYAGREKTFQGRLRKAGHQNLNIQLFGWELAA